MTFPILTPYFNPRATWGYGEGSTLALATRGHWSYWGQQVIARAVDIFEFTLPIVRQVQKNLAINREAEFELPIVREIRKELEG